MPSKAPSPALHVCRTPAGDLFLVASVGEGRDPGAAAAEAYAGIAQVLSGAQAEIVQERVFGSLSVQLAVRAARKESLEARGIRGDGALTYIDGRPTWGEGFAGVIVRAVIGRDVRTITDGGRACGRAWKADGATLVILQGFQGLPERPGDDAQRPAQARRAMEQADRILREQGGSYHDTARTWFYLSDILAWYGEFNRARNEKYNEFGLMPRPGEEQWRLPASTGIRAAPSGGGACSLDLLAVIDPEAGGTDADAAKTGGTRVGFVRNPRQQEAFCYGSAFSRCAVVHGDGVDLIEVSGTAAIDEKGRSLYPGDIRAQARCTLEKMAALLERAGGSLGDICAATVFLKNGNAAGAVQEILAEGGLASFPAVWVEADVCREELLFEIDAEAVVAR